MPPAAAGISRYTDEKTATTAIAARAVPAMARGRPRRTTTVDARTNKYTATKHAEVALTSSVVPVMPTARAALSLIHI